MSGLVRAREIVAANGKDMAKDFQAVTGGVRNLVTARNLVRGAVAADSVPAGTQVNLFFFRPADGAAREPVSVTPAQQVQPAVDVSASIVPTLTQPSTVSSA